MGMAIEEDAADRKRRELKERLVAQQEKERQNGYLINEFGEIIRNDLKREREDISYSDSDNDDIRETIQTLGRFTQAVSDRQTRYDKVWGMVKSIFYAYIGAVLSIVLMPSWFSPIYHEGNWLFYTALILIVLKCISTYGSWLSLKDDNKNTFFEPSTTKFRIYAGIWVVLFLIMLFGYSISVNYTMGVFCCIICVAWAYFKSYQCSKYIQENSQT